MSAPLEDRMDGELGNGWGVQFGTRPPRINPDAKRFELCATCLSVARDMGQPAVQSAALRVMAAIMAKNEPCPSDLRAVSVALSGYFR
jgi:hypothetical protein